MTCRVKYHGPYHELCSQHDSPDLNELQSIMSARKRKGLVAQPCVIVYTEEGAVLYAEKSGRIIADWATPDLVALATTGRHNRPSHRLGVMKIRDQTTDTWHIFEYVSTTDRMATYFRYVVYTPTTAQHCTSATTTIVSESQNHPIARKRQWFVRWQRQRRAVP